MTHASNHSGAIDPEHDPPTEPEVDGRQLRAVPAQRKPAGSGGPRTPVGEAKSSKNATKAGIFSKSPVLGDERPEDWEAHRQGLWDSLQPLGYLEEMLVDQMALNRQQKARITRSTNGILQHQFDALNHIDRDSLSRTTHWLPRSAGPAAADGWDLPRWPGLVGTALSAAGLAVASYLTYEHFTSSSTLACSDNGVINCLKVTTSSYSAVLGVPVAVLGLVFFAVMLVLQLPPTWRRPERAVRVGRLPWAAIGLGTVLYLLYAELFAIDAICLWCTAVHVLTLVLFGTTLFATATYPPSQTGVT